MLCSSCSYSREAQRDKLGPAHFYHNMHNNGLFKVLGEPLLADVTCHLLYTALAHSM